MDPNQTPPQVGVNSGNVGASATGQSVFANAPNRFKDTTPKGDIIIPPSTPEKPKGPVNKKLIAGVIAVIVIIAVVAVVVVIALTSGQSGSKKSNSGSSESSVSASEDATVAFNKYANFILTGEASEDRIPSEDEVESPVIIEKINAHDKDFMDEAKNYFDDFYNGLSDQGNGDTLENIASAYKDNFDFLYRYTGSSGLARKDILELFKKDGEAKTQELINSRLAIFLEDDPSSVSKRYGEAMSEYVSALIKQQAGSPEYADGKTVQELSSEASNIKKSAFAEAVSGCYAIDSQFYDTTEETEEAVDE